MTFLIRIKLMYLLVVVMLIKGPYALILGPVEIIKKQMKGRVQDNRGETFQISGRASWACQQMEFGL